MKNTAISCLINGVTRLAAIFVVCISFAADKLPDRITLTWTDNPATTQTVTWRTDMSVNNAVAQIAVATDNGHHMQSRTVEAISTPFSSEYGDVKYHQADFTGLLPDTLYAYRVGDGENWSGWFHFRTASTEPKPFSFIYFGDAQADIKTYWSRVFHEAFKDAPEAAFTLHAGDQINRAENDEQWGEWFDAPGWVNASVPVIATPGNHEYFYEGRGQKENRKWNTKKGEILEIHTTEEAIPDGSGGYIKATTADGRKGTITLDSKSRIVAIDKEIQQITGFKPADLAGKKPNASQLNDRYSEPGNPGLSSFWRPQFSFPLNGPEEVKETCYYIDYQGARMIVLNSNEHQEKQAEWLRGVLCNNPQRWTIISFHHPVFSPTIGRDNPELRNLLKPVFDEFSVDMVLTGHDHAYARTTDNKTVYIVSVSGPKLYNIDHQDWMIKAAEQIQLYQVVRVDTREIRYESRTATGRLYDAFVIKKQEGGEKEILELLPSGQ
jgi:3',5'-cyclic AMP phosphodiesterase CpdA